ncbi:MAG: ABC transporter permease, partial [Gemmatimonadetes bacterium]
MLFKHPGVTGIGVVALALGIGLTTIMFSIVYGALIRGLPVEGGDRIVHIERSKLVDDISSMGVSVHDYVDWRERQRSFEHLAAYYEGTANIRGTESAERFEGAFVTANTFTVLGVRPVVGRLFREDEDEPGAPLAVLIGYHVWRDRYGLDPNIEGRSIVLNGEPATIVGVMPEGFRFPVQQDVWVAHRQDPVAIERDGGIWLEVMGRLRPGVTVDQAMEEFDRIAVQLEAEHPETNTGVRVLMKPFTREYVGDEAVGLLLTMLGAVGLVLLVACANVANLLLARAALRQREIAIRTAMGASRRRVITQMLVESLALALVGAALGAAVAWVGIGWFDRAVQLSEPPYWMRFTLDLPILGFVAGLAALSGVVSGLIPAIKASGSAPHEILKDEGRGTSSLRIGRLSRALVVAELAFSAAVLVVAGLMIKGVTNLRTLDPGFRTEGVFTARIGLMEAEYPDTASRRRFFDEVLQRVRAEPSVRAATLTDRLPGLGTGRSWYAVEGASYASDRDYPFARSKVVGTGYFETFGIQPLAGRVFEESDDENSVPVVIVNRSLAEREWGSVNAALGKQMRQGRSDSDSPWLTVVGVVPDTWMQGLGNTDDDTEGFFLPLRQQDRRFVSLAAVGPSDPMTLTATVRDIVTGVDPDVPIYFVQSLDQAIEQQTWFYEVFGTLFAVFGAVALFLASVGLYGVMSFGVSRRTQELGIRMALGAGGGQLRALVMRQGVGQILLGLTVGLAVGFVLARGMTLIFFEVEPFDPAVMGIIALVLSATALLASFVPARRATRVDPMVALRY